MEFLDSAELLAGSVATVIDEIGEQSKNRKVKNRIDSHGDAQKPAKRPSQRLVYCWHGEFRYFQTG